MHQGRRGARACVRTPGMAHKQLVLTCYRAALREARRIDCQVSGLAVRAPMVFDTGMVQHGWSQPTEEYRMDMLRELLPGLLKVCLKGQRCQSSLGCTCQCSGGMLRWTRRCPGAPRSRSGN